MRKNFKIGLLALGCSAIAFASCSNDDDSNTTTIELTADFTFSVDSTNNLVTFTNTSEGSYTASEWNFGDSSATATTTNATHTYAKAGTYHVTLTITASDGSANSKQQDVVIENDNVEALLTPTVKKLIGNNGTATSGGKVWVFDRWNEYAPEVGEALDKSISSHLGLGEFNSYSQTWYATPPDGKTAAGWCIYDETFTFSLGNGGLKLDIANSGGRGYGRLRNNISKNTFPDATAWLDPNQDNAPSSAEAEFTYAGGAYTFSVTEPATEDGNAELTLSGNAFLGYYVGTQEYEIIYLTDEVLAVRVEDLNDRDDQGDPQQIDWIFVFIREDLKSDGPPTPPVPTKDPAVVSYPVEGFEGTPQFALTPENTTGCEIVDNPDKSGVNTSDKVYKYIKTEGNDPTWYANVYYLNEINKFDLSTNNKIKLKVYIPSSNDYTTEGEKAGHLTITTLQKQLVLKLQDHDLDASWQAWTTQVEVKNGGSDEPLATDTWLDLTFDFSSVSDRKDFDKIVIQFGQEGHTRPGTFYFDDLEFFTE
jgi:PKD repeat protein